MNNSDLMMREHWPMMGPFAGFISVIVILFLILGIAAFIKFLFFNKK